jgi:lysophospholipase
MNASMPTPQLHPTEAPPVGAAVTLHRLSVLPRERAVARLAIVHGYGEHSARYGEFMRWLADRDVACHSFDFRGHGRSSGRRGYVRRWDEYVHDLRTFLARPELRADEGVPLFLLGHSHGGLVVIAAAIAGAPELQHVTGVVLTNPYLRNAVLVPLHRRIVARVIDPLVPWARFSSRVRVEWLTSDPRMQQETIDDPLCHRCATPRWFLTMQQAQRSALERAGYFRLPMLMMIGARDGVADPQVCRKFFDRASSPDKALKVYPDLVHELLRESGRERVFADVFDWLGRRLTR